MAYACPVCESPQADGRHLANHLAFTAMIHGEDHEAWLDEHTPGWEQAGEDALAKRVVGEAPETDLSEAITDPTEGTERTDGEETGRSERFDRPARNERAPGREGGRTAVGFDAGNGESGEEENEEVAAILAEARELTERMHEGADAARTGGETESETERRDRSGAENREADSDSDSDESEGGR